jgi:hypothetical protein
MGEACYYIKGYNCSKETFEKIKEFFLEGSKAEDWWQEHRGIDREGKRGEFWSEFEQNFPLVTKYMKFRKLFGKDCNNDLAGELDFGTEEDIGDSMYLDEDEFRYSAVIWHCATWDGIANYLKKEFGLKNVRWISEEDANMFDLI